MQNMSIMNKEFSAEDFEKIDSRIKQALFGWQIETVHNGKPVSIPATYGSIIYPYKYFEVYKKEGDVNPGEAENEIQLYVSCGWKGMDDEVIIVLTIFGTDVLDGTDNVNAEIYKFGSDNIRVYRNSKLVTDFTKRFLYFWKRDINKVIVSV